KVTNLSEKEVAGVNIFGPEILDGEFMACVLVQRPRHVVHTATLKYMNVPLNALPQLYPSIPARIKAAEVDALIVSAILLVLIGLYVVIGHETPAIIFICIALFLLYEPVLVCWRGQTVGHRVMGIRIIDSVTGGKKFLFQVTGQIRSQSGSWHY